MICTVFFLIDSSHKKIKTHGSGSHSSGPGLERDRIFTQFFRGIGTGQDFYCGSGMGEV